MIEFVFGEGPMAAVFALKVGVLGFVLVGFGILESLGSSFSFGLR